MLGVAALLGSSAVLAQDQGLYLGGAYGQTKLNACGDVRDVFAMFGGTVSSCDDKDSGWKVFGGYRINRNFAIEATYIDWGSISGSGRLVGIPVTLGGDATSFGVAAVGILPLNESFSLFGKAGMLSTEVNATISGGGVVGNGNESDTELHIAVGGLFNLTGNWAIRAEWERAQDSKLEMISIGVQYRF
jgi:OOP family OmpA-OmpF porin